PYSTVIGSKHINLNATGGGFLTASKQFRHGATRHRRSTTAFPYTTLFRSRGASGRPARRPARWGLTPRPVPRGRPARDPARAPPDRKSTRLNSSHVSISYAVFCLKKKIATSKSRSNTASNSTKHTSPHSTG